MAKVYGIGVVVKRLTTLKLPIIALSGMSLFLILLMESSEFLIKGDEFLTKGFRIGSK
jgi:hypothetical protein